MYGDLRGKKLLILGAYKTEIEIVNAARELGVYSITTDNHEDWNLAPAKKVSDEAWNVSWSDIQTLEKKCIDANVDGLIAGFSERRVRYAKELAEKLNLPFYAENVILDFIFSKDAFRDICVKSGITVPKHFDINDEIKFPVIVKPVDNGGSRGISICNHKNELDFAYNKALSVSDSKKVIIEEYIDADEIIVYFNVYDGKIELSAMCDRCMQRFSENITQLPILYNYKSKYFELFLTKYYSKFKTLIQNLGIKNGLIGFQSLVRDNDIIPYDPTFRLDGSMSFHLIENKNDVNSLKMLIRYSLLGSMVDYNSVKVKENPKFSGYAVTVVILLGKGIIKRIEGLEEIKKNPFVVYVYQGIDVGAKMEEKASFSQIFCRILISTTSVDELNRVINLITDKLRVYDVNDKNMIINSFEYQHFIG